MDTLAPWIPDLLARVGPGLVLALAFLETVFITGLVMPTGPTIIVATLMARGVGGWGVESVVAAAMLGGLLGDSGGFWIGRRFGRRIFQGEGYFARAAARHLPRAASLASRHPAAGVTFARLISFVRTLSPQLAGMSRLTYPRFLAYDVVGVTGWAALYVGIALLAGESWRVVSGWIGATGGLLLLVALLVFVILVRIGKVGVEVEAVEARRPGPPHGRDSSC